MKIFLLLQILAQRLDSKSYFKTWFKAHTGITPKEYINRLKVKPAKLDLLDEKTITKVAFTWAITHRNILQHPLKSIPVPPLKRILQSIKIK